MSGNFAIKGGGGRTPNGKCHLKFPFWFFAPFPKTFPSPIDHIQYQIHQIWPSTKPVLKSAKQGAKLGSMQNCLFLNFLKQESPYNCMWKTRPPYHMNNEQASLRIFAEADEVTRLLAKEIKLQVQLVFSALSLHFKHMFAIQNIYQQWEKQTTLSSQCQKSREKLQRSMPWSHMMSVGKKVKETSILISSSFHNGHHHYQSNVLGFHDGQNRKVKQIKNIFNTAFIFMIFLIMTTFIIISKIIKIKKTGFLLFCITINKVTTRWEGPQSWPYHKYSCKMGYCIQIHV